MFEVPFQLGEGEKIISEIKPLPAFKTYIFIVTGFPVAIIALFVLMFLGFWMEVIEVFIFFLGLVSFLLFLGWLYVNLRYKWENYWITNKRIVRRKGLIGYSITSIPLERISDIIISRNIWERLLGIGGLSIQSFAGQVSYGRHGAEITFNAIINPEKLQKLIYKLIEEKRRREGLKF